MLGHHTHSRAEDRPAQIRAAQLKANVESLRHLEDAHEHAVREQVGPELIAEIEAASSAEWLPLELDVRISLSVVEVCGFDGAKRWAYDSTLEALGGALLRNLVRPALRLFGAKPQTVLRFAPQVLGSLLSNCGEFSVEYPDQRTSVIVGVDLPQAFSAPTYYAEGYGAVFAAACSIVDVVPSVRTVRVREGRVEWHLLEHFSP